MAAETSRKAGQTRYAAGLCLQAGAFKDDCAQHLWQGEVHGLIAPVGPAGFAEKLPEAEALYAEWGPLLHANTDMSTRFWDKYFGNGFEVQGGVDLSRCDELPEEHRQPCVDAALAYLERELGPMLDRKAGSAAFCALERPTSADIGAWFPNHPDPRLDPVIQARHAEICGSSGRSDRDGPG